MTLGVVTAGVTWCVVVKEFDDSMELLKRTPPSVWDVSELLPRSREGRCSINLEGEGRRHTPRRLIDACHIVVVQQWRATRGVGGGGKTVTTQLPARRLIHTKAYRSTERQRLEARCQRWGDARCRWLRVICQP